MDADKEGFLRNERSLIQTIGRAARHEKGKVIMYADKITNSMKKAIEETKRRRDMQKSHNLKYDIIPKTIFKSRESIMLQTKVADSAINIYEKKETKRSVNLLKNTKYTKKDIEHLLRKAKSEMKKAAKELKFIEAARLRDEYFELEKIYKSKNKS